MSGVDIRGTKSRRMVEYEEKRKFIIAKENFEEFCRKVGMDEW